MNREKDIILVVGATGNQGGAVASHLLSNGYRIRALTRKPESEKARSLAERGAEVVQADLNDPASLEQPLKGIWGVFAVFNTWEAGVEVEEVQGKRFAELARRRGVTHYVYSSVGSAHRQTGIPHFENKWRIEELVRSLRFPSHAIIRPVFFMENFLSPWFKPALLEGKLKMAIRPETRLQMIAVDDIGRFGLLAFEEHERMNGSAIDIAGDELSMPEAAGILSEEMGRQIRFEQEPIEAVRKWSGDYAAMLEWFDRVGYDVNIPALERGYGINLTRMADWASRTVVQEELVQA